MLYVNQIGEAQSPPPYTFPGVSINSFRLAADLEQLTRLCDDVLNVGDLEDRGFEFRPIFPFVDLEVLYYPRMEYAYFPPLGYITQNEFCVRIMVIKYIDIGGMLMPDGEVAIFCPCLIVDNPLSAFAGRDVLGYPKLLGSFTSSAASGPFTTISAPVFTSFTDEVEASAQPIVAIEAAGANARQLGAPGRNWPWGEIDVDAMNVAHQALGRSLVFTPGLFACVLMKQFRDPTLSTLNACYQAILQAYTFIEGTGHLGPLPAARITVNDYPSLRLASSLGIPAGTPLTPISQYHMECSFTFTEAVTLYANNSPWWWF
jgi:hypothetical protein